MKILSELLKLHIVVYANEKTMLCIYCAALYFEEFFKMYFVVATEDANVYCVYK